MPGTGPARKRSTGLLIGLSVGAVVVLIAVVAIVVIPQLPGGSGVNLANITSEPTVGTWEITGPLGAPNDTEPEYINGITVGQDQAVAFWSVRGDNTETWMSLINTATGEQKWGVPVGPGQLAPLRVLGYQPNQDYLVVFFDDGFGSAGSMSVEIATGDFQTESALIPIRSYASMAGDFIGWDAIAGTVGRYRAHDLSEVWSVEDRDTITYEDYPAVGESSLVVDGDVFDISDGSQRSWTMTKGADYWSVGPALLSVQETDGGKQVTAVDEKSGAEVWTKTIDGSTELVPARGTDLLAISNPTDDSTEFLRAKDGEGAGDVDVALNLNGYHLFEWLRFLPENLPIGQALLPTDQGSYSLFHWETGELGPSFGTALRLNGPILIGMTEDIYYDFDLDLGGADGSKLRAFDVASGDQLWEVEADYPQLLGGNLVATETGYGGKLAGIGVG